MLEATLTFYGAHVKLDVPSGQNVSKAIGFACELARKLDIIVSFRINGVALMVRPTSLAEDQELIFELTQQVRKLHEKR